MQPSGFQPSGFQPGDGSPASELLQEDGYRILKEDGGYLKLEAGTDVTVDGEILTVTVTLLSGVPSTNTTADELLQEDGFLILQEDGYNIVLDAASGDVSISGEILTATPSLIDGSVTGTAVVTGETLTATPTLIDGSVTGTAVVTGETLTATPTLTDGTVTGTASITGETLTATPSLIDGTVTGDASVTGETLTATPSLIDGNVTGNADVTGETLSITVTLIDGDVTTDGNASISGEILTATPTLVDGDVTGDANVDGETLTATPEFIEGTVTADANVTVDGETLVVSVILLDGIVTVAGVVTRPPGGDDAPRSHVGIAPKRVKDKYDKRGVDREDIEEIYNRLHGIEPQTKAGKRAIAAVQKAVAPGETELPPTLDWVAIDNDLKAVIAIRKAWQVIRDEEDAVIALLLAA